MMTDSRPDTVVETLTLVNSDVEAFTDTAAWIALAREHHVGINADAQLICTDCVVAWPCPERVEADLAILNLLEPTWAS